MGAFFVTECESRFIIDLLNEMYSHTEYDFERDEIIQAIDILEKSHKYDLTKVMELM